MASSDYLIFMYYVNSWSKYLLQAQRAARDGNWAECGTSLDLALIYLRSALSMLWARGRWSEEEIRRIVREETPRMTDAEIFDACYRELERRWGPAGAT